MAFANPIVGGTALRIPAIQSPDFVAGVSGWIIRIDGSAEFNNLTIRGQFTGTDFIINSAGIFIYSGTPANGNLIGSWTSAAGTDAFGNTYQAGLTILGASTSINLFAEDITLTASNGSKAVMESGLNAALYLTPASGPWSAGSLLSGVGGGSHPTVDLSSPTDLTNGFRSDILLEGSSSTDPTTIILSSADRWSHTGTLQVNTSDIGAGVQSQVSITANVSGLGVTETVLMTAPSMKFVNGRAYRATLWGLHQSTTADTHFLYRLRKGSASTTGTIYKDQIRIPTINTASTNSAVSAVVLLVNTSGADITTAVTWTGSCAVGTGIFAASAGNVATFTIEDIGLASQWTGQPVT